MPSGIDLIRQGQGTSGLNLLNQAPTTEVPQDITPIEPQSSVSGLNLIKPPEEPKAPDIAPAKEPIKEPRDRTTEFYSTHTPPIPFQGLVVPSVTPELAAYMGRKGYGPKPAGGWSEFGEPLDKDGNPYYKPQAATGAIAETLQGLTGLVTDPYETARGIMDFALSIPAFLTGMVGAAGAVGSKMIEAGANAYFDENYILRFGDVTLLDLYDAGAKAIEESFKFFEPGKEAMLGKPTEKSTLPAQIAMAPLTAATMASDKLANIKAFEGYPNIQGAIKIFGSGLGLLVNGMFLHRGTRGDFVFKTKKIVEDAAKLDEAQRILDESPETILKQANQAALDAKKAQLELEAKKLADQVSGDVVLREQLDALVEAQAKRRLRPTAYTGLKKRTPAQVRAVMERLPEGKAPDYTFTSNKGNLYMKVGDTWYDQNRVPVTNKSILEAAEAKKAKPGEEAPEYVPPEQPTVHDALKQAGYTDKQITSGVPEAEVAKALREYKKPEAKEPEVISEEPPKEIPKRKIERPYSEVKDEAQNLFDSLNMPEQKRDQLRRKRKIRVIEHTIAPGENVKIPATWHDAVFRYTAVKTPKGEIIPGEAGSYDTIMMPGRVAGAKEGPFPPGHTLYLFDTGGAGRTETNTLRIYRMEAETPTKVEAPKIDYFGEGEGAEPSISDDLAMIDAIEKHFGKKISEVSDKEMETFFTGEEITDVDTQIGEQVPRSKGQNSIFFQDKMTTDKFKQLFEDRAKSVAEDPNLFFQKLVNDANRWFHGEDVPIDQVREALRRLATESGEERYRREFISGSDHYAWREAVSDASEWASSLDRLPEPLHDPKLHSMIPLDKIPEAVIDWLEKTKNLVRSDLRKPVWPGDTRVTLTNLTGIKDDIYDIKGAYRNKELFDATGFWLGKDGKWRYELSDFNSDVKTSDLILAPGPVPLPDILKHPTLYDHLKEMRGVSIYLDPLVKPGRGSYSPSMKLITVGGGDRSTILHETTHAINHVVESKFQGTNQGVERVRIEMRDIVAKARIMEKYGKTEEIRSDGRKLAESVQEQLDSGEVNHSAYKFFEEYVESITDKELDPLRKAQLETPPARSGAFRNYQLDPGEMEARLTETRMYMTEVARKRHYPWDTLDIMLENEGYPKEAGHKLYTGISPEEIIASARKVASYTAKARGLKAFKPKEAAKMTRDEVVTATLDKSGNIRREMLANLSDEGYKILQKLVLTRGGSSLATHHLKQMSKEVYSGKDKGLRNIQDDVILAERMIDIGKYKTPKEFKFPEGVQLEDFVRYRKSYRYKSVNGVRDLTPEEILSVESGQQAYYDWMKKALKDLRDEGLISAEEYDNMIVHNYRKIKLVDIYDKKYKSKLGKKPLTVYDSGVEALARGRETDIYEPSSEIMALEVLNRTYGRILNNRANKALLDLARKDPTNPFVRYKASPKDSVPSGWNRIYVFEEGRREAIYLSPEMSKEWIHSSPDVSYRMGQLLRYISGAPILRTMATGLNWGFALANLPRDIMHIWYAARAFEDGRWQPIYSSHAPIYALQMGRDISSVFLDVINRTGKLNNYIEDGGGMEFLVHQGRLLRRGRHIKGPLDKFYDFMGYFGETSELLPRVAIRERRLRQLAKREGITMEEAERRQDLREEATFIARDYMDFGQGGWASKAADNAFPYLNAGIQGFRGFARAIKDNPVKTMYKLAQFGTIVVGGYIAMRKQNPKTTQALMGSVDMKNYMCIPLGDQFGFEDQEGQMRYPYLKIPLDPSQKFFKTFLEAATDKWLGNEVDVDRVVDSLKEFSPVGVTEMPPIMSAILGYITNKDFWLNEDIWRKTDKPFSFPYSKEEYVPGLTPEFYQDLGEKTGLSPERTRYAIEELVTSGTIWSYLLGKGYEATFGDMPKDMKEQHLAEVLAKVPVVKRFFGITHPYSQHAAVIDKAKQASDLERWVQNRNLDSLVEGHLFRGNVKKKRIREYIRQFKDPDDQKRLLERYVFHLKVKDLPNRSFWLRLKGLTTEARAKVYWHRYESLSHEEKKAFRKEVGIVSAAGGVITPSLWEEVGKLRRQSLNQSP